MDDYSKLKAACEAVIGPHFGDADDRFFELAKPAVILGMIAEIERLRAAELVVLLPAKTKAQYPPEFEAAYKAMPKWRSGSTQAAAYKAWKARITAGASPAEIQAGVEKYARYCAATGSEVKMAQTFFGPGEHFSADWTIPVASGRKGQIHGSIGKQDFSAGIGDDGSF